MVIFREHPVFFLGLKYAQLLLSLAVVAFEITQYVAYGKNYVLPDQHNDWFDKSQGEGDSNGQVKIWLLFVSNLTILRLGYSLVLFKKFWNKGFNIWIEIFFSALWLSTGLSNLDPVYRGTNDLNCQSPSMEVDPPRQHICDIWVTSVIVGWFIFGTFIVTTFITWKIPKEIKRKNQWIKNIYPSDSYNNEKNSNRKSFVSPRMSPVPQPIVTINNSSTDELEKGGVPELLLQSGLPADHRMSLKIVLPQIGPFGQSIDNSSEQQISQQQIHQPNEEQQPHQTNNDVIQTNDDSTLNSPETFNPNLLVLPSKKSAEVSSLHEVPL